MNSNIRILVVDDDPDIRHLIRIVLETNHYRVTEAHSGLEALHMLRGQPNYDLIVLDIMMPEMDGIEACKSMRQFSTVPILFLTAKTQIGDMADAYGSGGDDFLPKPFSPTTFLMKVESLLRRYRTYKGKREQYDDIPFQLDTDRRCVIKDGQVVDLTAKEYEIMLYLYLRRGLVVSVKEIYEDAWGDKYMPASTNTVMVHIMNLRKKLEVDPAAPQYIRTIWGKGYQFG